MPRETFFNLPREKAARIEAAAIEEFSSHDFAAASVNRIVERAGIAKGSFYQYFADMKDLYKHLLQRISEQKIAYLSPVMANPMAIDFFSLMREIYMAGLRFAMSHPELQRMGNRMLSDRNNPVFQEFVRENMRQSDVIFESLIRQGIERGDIRPDVDVPMIAWLISRMNTALADYYQEHVSQKIDEQYLAVVNRLIDLIGHGIGSKELEKHGTEQ